MPYFWCTESWNSQNFVFLCLQCHFKTKRVAFILFVVSLLFWIWDCTPIKQSLVEWNQFAEVAANVADFIKWHVPGKKLWKQGVEMVWLGWHRYTIQFLHSITDDRAARRGFKLRARGAMCKDAFRISEYSSSLKAVCCQTPHLFFFLMYYGLSMTSGNFWPHAVISHNNSKNIVTRSSAYGAVPPPKHTTRCDSLRGCNSGNVTGTYGQAPSSL